MQIAVQLNHPSPEKPFSIGKGYIQLNNQIIREWNNDECHYRKFICSQGDFVDNLKSFPQSNNLLFWGEWEGNSFFHKINAGKGSPNGIHVPFHSISNRGIQNTDPYVFGESFKYAVCSQTGVMYNLSNNSVVLFGTTTKQGFLLDTVFVVKSHKSAKDVKKTDYTQVYQEETLEQLGDRYSCSNLTSKNKLYEGQTWWDCNDFFSFVPCKLESSNSHERAILKLPCLSNQKVGHPYKHFSSMTSKDVWNEIVDDVLKQGFLLGVKFAEPEIVNLGLISQNQTTKPNCV